jgi:hypothetical protein
MKVYVELEIDINLLDVKMDDVKNLVSDMINSERIEAVKKVEIKNVRIG